VAGLSPKVVIVRADPPASRTLLLDERVQISKRRQLVAGSLRSSQHEVLNALTRWCCYSYNCYNCSRRRERYFSITSTRHPSLLLLKYPQLIGQAHVSMRAGIHATKHDESVRWHPLGTVLAATHHMAA
jgi:hypothetical protein